MPELPEVEVTRLGVEPHVRGRTVTAVILRRDGLRWPFPAGLQQLLSGQTVLKTDRRGKYLILEFSGGYLLIHLGMSGHLRVLPAATPAGKHDHIDLVFGDTALRMTDPRRFGAVLWHQREAGELQQHPLLRGLGIEPLTPAFDGDWLYRHTRGKRVAVKQMLLAGDLVVGVGNIYASESLFQAAINPKTQAGRVSLARYRLLAEAIRQVLAAAIERGGSSLRDFIGVDGQTGYFQQSYYVYERAGQPCRECGCIIRQIRQGQRSTFYCPRCQK